MSKFCANLSFMFTEKPFIERYALAKNAGFKAVESGFPFGLTIEQVVNVKSTVNIEQILINVYTGDVTKGELGFAAIPNKENEFKDSIQTTINYAKALNVKKIHIMSGKIDDGYVSEINHLTFLNNLYYAVDVLKKENFIGLIEPINNYSVPNYYLNSYKTAIDVIKKINSPHLRLMLDIFHLQHIQGNVTNTIKEFAEYIGHVQIAQVPHRNEPNTDGELNYKYILKELANVGYKDWIGLEYKPLKGSTGGLNWIQDFGYSL